MDNFVFVFLLDILFCVFRFSGDCMLFVSPSTLFK